MYISKVRISNYRSFGVKEQEVNFCSPKFALIGRNNSGKSNLISAIDILLGNRDPRYIHTEEIDYFDPNQPLKIEIELLARNGGEIYNLALPNKHQAAFYGKFKKDPLSAIVKVTFQDALQESNKPPDGKFILNIAALLSGCFLKVSL